MHLISDITVGGGYAFVLPPIYDSKALNITIRGDIPSYEVKELCEFSERFKSVSVQIWPDLSEVTDASFITEFQNLHSLKLFNGVYPFEDGFLNCLPNTVTKLHIETSAKLSLTFINNLSNLEELYLESNKKDFNKLTPLENLKDLTIRGLTFKSLKPVYRVAPDIEHLDIKLGGTSDLSILPQFTKLKYLELWRIRGLNDISFLSHCCSLQHIFLEALPQITEMPDLSKLIKLRRLHLKTMKGLIDLSAINTAPILEDLIVENVTHMDVEHFLPIKQNHTLKTLGLGLGSEKKRIAITDLAGLPNTSDTPFEYK